MFGDSALKRKRDKKDLQEVSKSMMTSPADHVPHSTDKKNREIPEARQLRFEEDDTLPLKRLKTNEAPK